MVNNLEQFRSSGPKVVIDEGSGRVLFGEKTHRIVTSDGKTFGVTEFLDKLVEHGELTKKQEVNRQDDDGGTLYQGVKRTTVVVYSGAENKTLAVDYEEDYQGWYHGFLGGGGLSDQSRYDHTIAIEPDFLKKTGAEVRVQREIRKIKFPSRKVRPL